MATSRIFRGGHCRETQAPAPLTVDEMGKFIVHGRKKKETHSANYLPTLGTKFHPNVYVRVISPNGDVAACI